MKQKKQINKIITAFDFPYPTEEKAVYSIQIWKGTGKKYSVGKITFSISHSTDHFKVNYSSEATDYLFEGKATEKAQAVVNRLTLRPITVAVQFNQSSSSGHLEATYKKDRVSLVMNKNGIKEKWSEKVPFEVADNYHFLMAMRALDYEHFQMDTLCVVNPLSPIVYETVITPADKEHVTTPAGIFECRRVCAQIFDPVPFTQYNLYAVTAPHHLVKVTKGHIIYELEKLE